jgi:hypothetical protein
MTNDQKALLIAAQLAGRLRPSARRPLFKWALFGAFGNGQEADWWSARDDADALRLLEKLR